MNNLLFSKFLFIDMWNKILLCYVILDGLQFANSNKTTNAVTIKEVCVPHQIAELERYLEEHDIPEVPISNTTPYTQPVGVDDNYDSTAAARELNRFSAGGQIELLPFGAHPVDWKRLQVLHDLLNRPDDQELKSKLFGLVKILLAAYQRVQEHSILYKHLSSTPVQEESNHAKLRNEDKGVFSTPESIEGFENSGTTRHRLGRSTNSEETEKEPQDFSAVSSGTEAALNIGFGFSDTPDFGHESWTLEPKNVILQLEEIEETFKDGDFINLGSKENEFENPEHLDSQLTINEIRSRDHPEEAGVATEEIKPDGRDWHLETITPPLPHFFTSSPSLLTIDQETTQKSSSPTSGTAVLQPVDYSGKKIETSTSAGVENFEKGSKFVGTASEDQNSFLVSEKIKEEIENEEEKIPESVTKGKESFLNIPGRVELVFIKNGDEKEGRGRHVSRVHNFDDGRGDGGGGGSRRIDSSQEYNFYDGKYEPRTGQESPLIFYRDKLQRGIFPSSNMPVSKNGRHKKRGGDNTDIQKLYRWFYRAGDGPGKSDAGGAEIKCKESKKFNTRLID